MSLIALVATDEDFGIGKDNDLVWHCPQDLAIFKQKTSGKVIVMGRKTLESLPKGKPLPNRTNIVLTRKVPEDSVEGVEYHTDIDKVLELAKEQEVYVIGGGEIYELFGKHYDEIHETNIKGIHSCDTFAKFNNVSFEYDTVDADTVYPASFDEEGCIADSITIYKFNKQEKDQ